MQGAIRVERFKAVCWQKQKMETCPSLKQSYRLMPIMPSLTTSQYLSFKKTLLNISK